MTVPESTGKLIIMARLKQVPYVGVLDLRFTKPLPMDPACLETTDSAL